MKNVARNESQEITGLVIVTLYIVNQEATMFTSTMQPASKPQLVSLMWWFAFWVVWQNMNLKLCTCLFSCDPFCEYILLTTNEYISTSLLISSYQMLFGPLYVVTFLYYIHVSSTFIHLFGIVWSILVSFSTVVMIHQNVVVDFT